MEKVELKQQKGVFQAKGLIFGVSGQNFFKASDKNADFKMMTFGLRVSNSENIFLTLNSMKPKEIWYSKSEKQSDGKYKNETKKLEYGRSAGEGWKAIGVSITLEKGENGKNVPTESYHNYDAIMYLKDHLKDDMPVFIKGNIEWSSFKDKDGNVKKSKKLIPTAVYLGDSAYDVNSPDWEKQCEFLQPIVFLGGERTEGKNYLNVGVVGYNAWEEGQLEVTDVVYSAFKEKMKPYYAINVSGKIVAEAVVEQEVVEDDTWGEKTSIGKRKTPSVVKLIVDGAVGTTLNREDYKKQIIDKYIEWVKFSEEEKAAKKGGFDSQGDFGNIGESSNVKHDDGPAW